MHANGLMSGALALAALTITSGEAAARTCFHSWAVPGKYVIYGKFRSQVEAAGARLSRDCRVTIRVPGVFSGTKVRKAGRCLRFKFKVEGVRRSFTARWCNKIGYIPWKGRQIRARVEFVQRLAGTQGPAGTTGSVQ